MTFYGKFNIETFPNWTKKWRKYGIIFIEAINNNSFTYKEFNVTENYLIASHEYLLYHTLFKSLEKNKK